MSTFNPELFEQTVIDQAGDTEYTPIPAGEYVGFIKDFKVRSIEKEGQPDAHVMDVFYQLVDLPQEVLDKLAVDEAIVKGNCWLDINDQGGLKFGANQNIQLNRLRDAVDQNVNGQPWNPGMLRGAGPVKLGVTVEPAKSGDAVYNRVVSVVKHNVA